MEKNEENKEKTFTENIKKFVFNNIRETKFFSPSIFIPTTIGFFVGASIGFKKFRPDNYLESLPNYLIKFATMTEVLKYASFYSYIGYCCGQNYFITSITLYFAYFGIYSNITKELLEN